MFHTVSLLVCGTTGEVSRLAVTTSENEAMNEAFTGWLQRHLEADRNRFRVTAGGVMSRLFAVEPDGSSDIVCTLLHTANHTPVTHSSVTQ